MPNVVPLPDGHGGVEVGLPRHGSASCLTAGTFLPRPLCGRQGGCPRGLSAGTEAEPGPGDAGGGTGTVLAPGAPAVPQQRVGGLSRCVLCARCPGAFGREAEGAARTEPAGSAEPAGLTHGGTPRSILWRMWLFRSARHGRPGEHGCRRAPEVPSARSPHHSPLARAQDGGAGRAGARRGGAAGAMLGLREEPPPPATAAAAVAVAARGGHCRRDRGRRRAHRRAPGPGGGRRGTMAAAEEPVAAPSRCCCRRHRGPPPPPLLLVLLPLLLLPLFPSGLGATAPPPPAGWGPPARRGCPAAVPCRAAALPPGLPPAPRRRSPPRCLPRAAQPRPLPLVPAPAQGRRGRRAAPNRHPLFPQYNYQAEVAENQPAGTAVVAVAAQDPDGGEAGRLVYSMDALMNSRSLDLFSIDPRAGLISTTQALDRESMDLHYFRVTATDHGAPRLSATTMVAITVADRNDHDPVFEQGEYRETIRENVEEGYPILQLRATDVDSLPNANIRYRFVNERAAYDVFEIDPRSGLITTSGPVDREKMEKYSLVVEASDQGREPGPRSTTVKVYITVLDENDNIPQFSEKRYIVQVREDIRPHTEILRITATDLDKDNNALVHYNIISGNSRGQFSIDSVTGEIQVVAPLDFEVEREYTLRIRAQDAGRPPLSNNTGMASIQVVDINDHAPIFVSTPFQISVLENAPLGHSVIHIQAVDADYGENSRLEYKLTGVSADTPFVVNSATGWITVSGPLDRESVEHYFFGVEARDHGSPSLSASASVTITVMDVNDNRPEFTQKEYFIRLNEDAAVGTSVLSVTAVDRDVNSAITYQITGGNTRNRFSISTQGGLGLITLSLPLDYKQERRYVLTVTASDRTLRDNCHVHINITDANTHRPVFQSAHYSVSINEDRPVGSTVVVISATDDDVGENARITYYLEDNVPQFRIDPDSGAITLQAELDYEDQVTYTLAITAKDNGIPQKADTTYVEIMVNDVNDNAPQFVSPHYQGMISEDAPPFTSVLQISATDRDAHTNGRVQYTFQNGEDGDGDFTIEPTSGIIRTVRRLDRENAPVYELTAYAVDRGIPPQRTPVHIQVTIQDVNDNAPVFPAEEFEVLVKENSIIGSVVAQITAVDPDEGPNAQIMYQIVEGNIPEIFQMDIFSGELTALIDLDYETKSEYVIVVQATSAPLVSRATVHIKLIDQNDNSPVLKNFQILFNNYVSNKSNTFPSGVIGKVPAYDPDASDRLFYTFERGNELRLLIVNQSSGELRLSRKLDNNRPLVASMLVTVTGRE